MQTLQRYSQVLIFIYLNTYNTLYQPPQQFLVWYNYRFTDCEHLQHTVLQLDEMDFYYSKDKPIFKDLNLNTQSDSRIDQSLSTPQLLFQPYDKDWFIVIKGHTSHANKSLFAANISFFRFPLFRIKALYMFNIF